MYNNLFDCLNCFHPKRNFIDPILYIKSNKYVMLVLLFTRLVSKVINTYVYATRRNNWNFIIFRSLNTVLFNGVITLSEIFRTGCG